MMTWMRAIGLCVFLSAIISCSAFAEPSSMIDLGELNRLISLHLPQKQKQDFPPNDFVESRFLMEDGPTIFWIPGFKSYGCGECHAGEKILERAAERMRLAVGRLKVAMPEIGEIPLRQYIIQPWADEWLQPRQFAHTTFDSIRIFPRTLIIDDKVYGHATHIHETLHLTQSFLGHANELEAYALNVRIDPRFLILNFPYFADVVKMFHVPDFKRLLDEFFARPVREGFAVPREVQWYMDAFDPDALERIRQAVKKMEPLFEEVTRLNRQYPLESAYLSEQTGVPSLLLEIAASELYPLPEISEEVREKAFAILDKQMTNADNTRLGLKVDRKTEAFLWITSRLKLRDPAQKLGLYFHYLKSRFIGPDGHVLLQVPDAEDFQSFVDHQMNGVEKMARSGLMTPIEKQAAKKFLSNIQALQKKKHE